MITLIVELLMVALAHVSMNLWLYQGRIQNRHALFHSDLLVFGLPALLALGVYTFLIRQEMMTRLAVRRPTILSLALALLPTIISTWMSLYIGFNRCGT